MAIISSIKLIWMICNHWAINFPNMKKCKNALSKCFCCYTIITRCNIYITLSTEWMYNFVSSIQQQKLSRYIVYSAITQTVTVIKSDGADPTKNLSNSSEAILYHPLQDRTDYPESILIARLYYFFILTNINLKHILQIMYYCRIRQT